MGIRATPLSLPPSTATTDEDAKSSGNWRETDPDEMSIISAHSGESTMTSASGATKRSKSGKRGGKRPRSRTTSAGFSSSRKDSEDSLEPKKRRRERLPITGKGVLIRARRVEKELKTHKKDLQKIKQNAAEELDLRKYRPHGPKEVEMREEIRVLPSRDIAAELATAVKKIGQVAVSTKNLKRIH